MSISPRRFNGRLAAAVLVSFLLPLAAIASENSEPPSVVPPQIILGSQRPPVFPPAALAARFSGSVTMELDVLADGTVGEVRVVDCTHTKVGFEQASIDAVKQWRFDPALERGEPIESTLRFRLSFNRSRPGSPEHVSVSPFAAGGSSGANDASVTSTPTSKSD